MKRYILINAFLITIMLMSGCRKESITFEEAFTIDKTVNEISEISEGYYFPYFMLNPIKKIKLNEITFDIVIEDRGLYDYYDTKEFEVQISTLDNNEKIRSTKWFNYNLSENSTLTLTNITIKDLNCRIKNLDTSFTITVYIREKGSNNTINPFFAEVRIEDISIDGYLL